jgi:cell division protein FtsB
MRLARRQLALMLLLALAIANTACPFGVKSPSDVEKVENKLNQGANALNALAKTNRELYRQNVINLENRRTVAAVINKANSALDKVTERVYQINPGDPSSISTGKLDVIKLMEEVNQYLNEINVGNEQIRIAAQAIITIINEAIDLTRRIKEIR